MEDPYKVLGVKASDDLDTIKRAYRKLAKKHHPDLNHGDPNAPERFRRVQEAWDYINNHGKQEEKVPMWLHRTLFSIYKKGA